MRARAWESSGTVTGISPCLFFVRKGYGSMRVRITLAALGLAGLALTGGALAGTAAAAPTTTTPVAADDHDNPNGEQYTNSEHKKGGLTGLSVLDML